MMNTRGFTLIEVLIALVVLAIGLLALMQGSGNHLKNASQLQDRIVASWVAHNRFNQYQLDTGWVQVGTTSGLEEMLGQTWHWRTLTEELANTDIRPYLRQVTIEVRTSDSQERARATLRGFVGNPTMRAQRDQAQAN